MDNREEEEEEEDATNDDNDDDDDDSGFLHRDDDDINDNDDDDDDDDGIVHALRGTNVVDRSPVHVHASLDGTDSHMPQERALTRLGVAVHDFFPFLGSFGSILPISFMLEG